VDFYCWKKKIAIELDGGIHQHPEVKDRDIARQTFLEENGINVIRFRNKEVLKDVSTVLEKILCIMN
jgi:cyclase